MRNHLVIETTERHVSSVLLADEEIADAIGVEEWGHTAAGWDVQRFGDTIRAEKGNVTRWVWVRSKQREDDTL
jgi:hypothetical protein